MSESEFKKMTFDERLDFFSKRRASSVPFYPRPFELRFMSRVGGINVTLGRENITRDEALKQAKEYKLQCSEYPRNSIKAKLYDMKLTNDNQ